MATYYLSREDELAPVKESVYGTSAGDPVGADFFKHTSSHVSIVRQLEAGYRDRDRDNSQASVIDMYTGREKTAVSVECDLVPSNNASTPTAPDVDVLLDLVFGSKATRTAHTTLTSSSTTTLLKLTAGGAAASGVAVGDLIACDVSSTYGLEVRQVTAISTDDVTVDRAFSAAPASGRSVYVGTTYKLSVASLQSMHLWLFNGSNKYKVPGVILNEVDFSINYADQIPMGKFRFNGEGQPEVTQSVSRPTPSTAGTPLVPTKGTIWLGTTKYPIISGGFNLKNGLELRNNESDQLKPTAAKRTGNNSRYVVEASLEMYFTSDSKTLYDGAATLSALDAIVQHGTTAGRIFAYRLPAWHPRGERTEQDGEVGLRLAGRALGVSGDDEIRVAFI